MKYIFLTSLPLELFQCTNLTKVREVFAHEARNINVIENIFSENMFHYPEQFRFSSVLWMWLWRHKTKIPVQKMILAAFFIKFLKASLVSSLGCVTLWCFLQQSEADRLRGKSPLVNDGSLGGRAGWMPQVPEDVWSMFLRGSWESVFHFNPLESAKHQGGQTATLNLT